MLALLLALFTPGNQICRITFGPFNHSSGLAQNGDPYQCKDSNPISVVLEGPHRSVGKKTFDPSVAKAEALKTPFFAELHSKSYPQFAREEDASGESRCHWKVSALHGGQVANP